MKCVFYWRISEAISDAHIPFVKAWMQSHIEDAENALGMPVLFGEFGVCSEDPGYNTSFWDTLFSIMFNTILNSTKKGGNGGGSLLWQLFPEGTDYMDDGYAIVLSKSPSTSDIISLHSKRLTTFNSFCSWKCHWGCKKKHPLETFVYHDDLWIVWVMYRRMIILPHSMYIYMKFWNHIYRTMEELKQLLSCFRKSLQFFGNKFQTKIPHPKSSLQHD